MLSAKDAREVPAKPADVNRVWGQHSRLRMGKRVRNSPVTAAARRVRTLKEGGENKRGRETRACVEPLRRQRRTFFPSRRARDCNSSGILPTPECDLILTDGADELRCAAAFFLLFTVAQQKP